MLLHHLLACIVSNCCPVCFPLQITSFFSGPSGSFKIFSLSPVLSNLIVMCLGVGCLFVLISYSWGSWLTWIYGFSSNWEMFLSLFLQILCLSAPQVCVTQLIVYLCFLALFRYFRVSYVFFTSFIFSSVKLNLFVLRLAVFISRQ